MDIMDKKFLVIIPAYNEEKRIDGVVRSIKDIYPMGDVLVVNDGSTDRTGEDAHRAGAIVLTHPVNLGYGSSLELGYFYALKHDYDIVVQMDGDGQHIAGEITKILSPVVHGEADIVIGSRYLHDENSYKTSLARRLGQKFFSAVFILLTHAAITDPTSGFQCLTRKVFKLYAHSRFPEDFPDTDVLLMASFAGFRVKEVPVVMANRSGGISMHAGLKPFYYMVKMVLSIFMVCLSYRRWKKIVS